MRYQATQRWTCYFSKNFLETFMLMPSARYWITWGECQLWSLTSIRNIPDSDSKAYVKLSSCILFRTLFSKTFSHPLELAVMGIDISYYIYKFIICLIHAVFKTIDDRKQASLSFLSLLSFTVITPSQTLLHFQFPHSYLYFYFIYF